MVLMMIMMLNDDGGVDLTKMNDPDRQRITNIPDAVIKCEDSSRPQRREGRELELQCTKLTSI